MSTLRAKYEAYLAAPSTGALAEAASIHYVPTLTTINEPTGILKHLAAQQKLLKKKGERILSAIESSNGLCVDTETTIEFIAGGGAILPGLDDNFLADKIVILPMIHIVQFDANQKILQIRYYWDQGSLLKQVDVIGARSRNWPIRDGKDQVRLISRSATIEDIAAHAPSYSRRSTKSSDEVVVNSRSRGSTTSATGDPHASLSLFAPRDVNADEGDYRSSGPSYARASSAKPPSRNLTDILAAPQERGNGNSSHVRSASPSKAGAGKNYGPIRLFDDQEPTGTSPERGTKGGIARQTSHFEFGDGEEAISKKNATTGKHSSQWNFEDFVTPDKPKPKVRTSDNRTMTWEDDEEGEKSPVFRAPTHKARPDAETHFDFVDDGTPAADKRKHETGKSRPLKDGMGLYQDNVTDQDDTKKPLTTGTNVNKNDRARDFAAHYEIADNSPSVAKKEAPVQEKKKPLDQPKQKQQKGLESKWSLFEEEADIIAKENAMPVRKIYKTANDGMGGNKSGGGRSWGIGDDSAGEDENVKHVKPKAGRSGQAGKQAEAKGFWEF